MFKGMYLLISRGGGHILGPVNGMESNEQCRSRLLKGVRLSERLIGTGRIQM